jgi:hypothetical protein
MTTRSKKTLPILDTLDDLRVATPCHADWDQMTPVSATDGARARFCGSCEKNVYDLSAMTRGDAMSLIERHEGQVCVRFYQRADGTVLTADCPVGVRAALKRAERRALATMAAGIGAVAALVAFFVGSNPLSRRFQVIEQKIEAVVSPPAMMGSPPPPPAMMGEVAPEPEHPTMGKPSVPRATMGAVAGPPDAP